MGYQVGTICYANRELAENVYFSQVLPVIMADGSLKQVTHKDGKWYYGVQTVNAYLPQCSAKDNFIAGLDFGAMLLPTAIALMIAKIIINLFK